MEEIKTIVSSEGLTYVDMGTGKNLFSFGPSPIIKDFEEWDYIKIPKNQFRSISIKDTSPYSLTESELTIIGTPIYEKEKTENKENKENKNKKEKEKKKIMELLELYERFQTENIEKSFDKQMDEILEKDELVQAAKEYNQRLNLLEDNVRREHLKLDIERVLTTETQNEVNKIRNTIKVATYKLKDKCNIIKAHLELADTFEEKQEILKSYNVIDKNGKLNVLDNNCEEKDEINIKVEALDLPEEKVRKEKKLWKK